MGATERAQWGKELAAEPEDLSSNLKTHMVEGENQLLPVTLWPRRKTT